MPHIKVVYWRDIPAQVIAEEGRGRNRRQAKVELPKRFSIAIDAAAMKCGADSTDDYLNDWRRSEPEDIGNDLDHEAKELGKKLDAQFNKEKLMNLVMNGGFEK